MLTLGSVLRIPRFAGIKWQAGGLSGSASAESVVKLGHHMSIIEDTIIEWKKGNKLKHV